MGKDLRCALIAVLLSRHAWGSPLPKDVVVNLASYESHRGGEAKDAFEQLRSMEFMEDHRTRGIALDNSAFDEFAIFLSQECRWGRDRIKLKHFEGWDELDL